MVIEAKHNIMSRLSKRPILCRLCGFPAPDGGVPVSQLDKEKLSEWCLRMMDTELDQERLENALICHFCVRDARFEEDNNKQNTLGLWSNIQETTIERNYSEYWLQPCTVEIDILAEKSNPEPSTESRRSHHACPYCQEVFTSKLKLLRHVKIHHKDVLISFCEFCSSFFQSKVDAAKHKRQNHLKSLTCFYCQKQFESRLIKKTHIAKDHKDQVVQCPYQRCKTRYFWTKEEREDHVQQVHLTKKERAEKCPYCSKISSSRSALFAHILYFHKSERIKCNFNQKCPTYFKTEKERKKHIQKVHKTKVLKQFQCIYCKRPFLEAKVLTKHVDKEHSKVKIRCKWSKKCSQHFLNQKEYQQHFEKAHAQKEAQMKVLSCQFCEHKTFYKPDLRFHILRMHGDQSLQCPHCPRILKSQFAMDEHTKTHKYVKERCKTCSGWFLYMRKHKIKRKCVFCSRIFDCVGLHTQHLGRCRRNPKSLSFRSNLKL